MSPQISIIVPIYKAERFLSKCVDSIISQTYLNWELLLIDDGSPDKSGIICDEYAKKDPRIKVFHKENGGVSSARNLGLYEATGKYITFIDSDDWVENSYLEDFIIKDSSSDKTLIIQGIQQDYPGKKSAIMFKYPNATLTFKNDIDKIKKYGILFNGCPVAKLFLKDIIIQEGLKFDTSISLNEDHLFFISYLKCVETISLVDSINYHYFYDFKIPSLTKIKHQSSESVVTAYLLNQAFYKLVLKHQLKLSDWAQCYSFFGPTQLLRASKASFNEANSFIKFKEINIAFNEMVKELDILHFTELYSKIYIYFNNKCNIRVLFGILYLIKEIENVKTMSKFLVKKYILGI